MQVAAGSTDVSTRIRAMTSAGAALTGKVAADFTAWYRRTPAGAKTAIALSDLAALTTAHTDGGIKEIGDGWYRLDLPDAVCADGALSADFGGSVSGGVVLNGEISLTDASVGNNTVNFEVTNSSTSALLQNATI